jgi:hypothetical protein
VISALVAGCSPERDPVTANRILSPEDGQSSLQLSASQEGEATEAMRFALDGTPLERPTPARHGVRWEDVWLAVYWSIAEFEMAILRYSEPSPGRMVFELESALDEPATLVIERVETPEYIRATATVGSFGQREATARAMELAFRRVLEDFGRKPGFEASYPAP